MEPSTPANQGFIAGRSYKILTTFLAFAVTTDVSLVIVRHWKTYDWLGKFLGIVLLLNLLIVFLTRTIKLGKEEKRKPEMLQTAYIWLLLATMLFNR